MRKQILITGTCLLLLAVGSFALAATPTPSTGGVAIPPGQPITLGTIEDIVSTLTDFLIYLGGMVAVFMVILSGILWTTAGGSPTRLGAAKNMFKAALIGSIIILGVGVILNTIENCLQGDCFEIGRGGQSNNTVIPPTSPRPTTSPRTGKGITESCRADQECAEGLHCRDSSAEQLGFCFPEE